MEFEKLFAKLNHFIEEFQQNPRAEHLELYHLELSSLIMNTKFTQEQLSAIYAKLNLLQELFAKEKQKLIDESRMLDENQLGLRQYVKTENLS